MRRAAPGEEEAMKFLIVATRRDQMPAPPAALAGMLAAQRDWLTEQVDDGRIDVVYGFPQGGGVAIADAADADELNTVLMSSPAFWINDWDIRPLAAIDTVLTNAAEGLSRAFVGIAA
jgi:muconolactone delta-isomerase